MNKQNKNRPVTSRILITLVAFFSACNLLPSFINHRAMAATGVTETVQVIVYSDFPTVKILSPLNDSAVVDSSVEASIRYENITLMEATLKYQVDGEWIVHDLGTFYPEDRDPVYNIASGVMNLPVFDLKDFNGYGDYILTVTGRGGGAFYEDEIKFSYSSLAIDNVGTAANKDPIVNVRYGEDIGSFEITITDKKGNALLDEPIRYEVPNPGEIGSKEFTLPFESFGAIEGDYLVTVTGYLSEDDPAYEEGEPYAYAYATIHYIPLPPPDVPKTGSAIGSLNIAKTDYLATFSIAFVLSVSCAMYFLTHKKEQRKIRRRR